MENIEIRSFNNGYMQYFIKMFTKYFRNDFKIEITEKEICKACTEIGEFSISGTSTLDLLFLNEEPVGFIFFQIDTPQSNWCEREGWGFIREIYIDPVFRKSGLGARLISHAEKNLYSNGVRNIYLTSDSNETFWDSLGYKKTDEVSTINHDPIYEK
ncbi:GNAT family N-acetyltransferase [Anaerocolumna xylanovorans]|uniref:Acetyltransferase (GNAT) family protein n=1 Tax=Anaerocolumna xylanovorans DSM 12503 TaxID=1121345 RepID=A0A1M7YMZ8_9FIRM|nr:GNAT family N-acetyltransferase [Anaerocolumna xylanovorans]SHO54019.1 Acetyltransferase (GNAT) family protein [Anaerocolumna xylanovorans DSM 12503]